MDIEKKAGEFYAKGLWRLSDLEALVSKGKLSSGAVYRITGTEIDGQDGVDYTVNWVSLSPQDVRASLSRYSPKAEIQQACTWLGIPFANETKAQLLALIDAFIASLEAPEQAG